ncbi:MAG TPA: hypothetical protein VF842_04420 [Flavobacterium sp.]
MKNPFFLFVAALFINGLTSAQIRPYDKRGLNVFESPKVEPQKFDGIKLKVGGSFTQSWQSLRHSNTAAPKIVSGFDQNKLIGIKPGFNTANANLYLDVQLEDGIYLNLTTYLSSRHHNETWVKGGYIQFDKLTFLNSGFLDRVMKYTVIKLGHMEINYGDTHFRRSDNGNSIYNPFVENYIMDSFTTEIGAEIDVYRNGFLGVVSVTNGEIKGDIGEYAPVPDASDGKRHAALIGKLGYDKQLTKKVRLRVTSSVYYTAGSSSNTLYGGDRAGSHYFGVIENALATSAAFSGRFNPGFTDKITSLMGNIFLKVGGFEFFTTLESSKGRNRTETSERKASQFASDLVYRFGKRENFWFGTRYNTVKSDMIELVDVKLDRIALSGGCFVTKNIMTKVEYVNQNYDDFVSTDIRNGGKFSGLVIEAVVGF